MKRWLLRLIRWIEIPLPAPARGRSPFDEG